MDAYQCDFCNRLFSDKPYNLAINCNARGVGSRIITLCGRAAKLYDVCPICAEAFKQWVQTRNQSAETGDE